MDIEVTEFHIKNLYGYKNIDITFNNRLIIVGENGLGKSTIIKIFYYFISCQWIKINEYSFEEISVVINNKKILYKKNFFNKNVSSEKNKIDVDSATQKIINSSYERLLNDKPKHSLSNIDYQTISSDTGFSLGKVIHYLQLTEPYINLEDIEREIKTIFKIKILYLPTSRRIEQDLKEIYPILAENLEQVSFLLNKISKKDHIELIEFGMEDVILIISEFMKKLKDVLRTALNDLTAKYLKHVILGDYLEINNYNLEHINIEYIERILDKMDNSILSRDIKDKIIIKSEQLKNREKSNFTNEEKNLVQFLSLLDEVYKEYFQKEKYVKDFINTCNKYLYDKVLIFDEINFYITVKLTRLVTKSSYYIELKNLSSGEKQIISLFSHLFLSNENNLFILIDEPELSLSVEWQTTFLEDISKSPNCRGFIAATHSPFIFKNELRKFVKPVESFMV